MYQGTPDGNHATVLYCINLHAHFYASQFIVTARRTDCAISTKGCEETARRKAHYLFILLQEAGSLFVLKAIQSSSGDNH